MMGIYKITNDLNGMSYIGQSIHCGKRLDEHFKGDQYIDQVIQTVGMDNFSMKFLREVNKSELSVWEDYYIMKYNTMYPNGYNKRWNCSKDLRNIILGNNNDDEPENIARIIAYKEESEPFKNVYISELEKETIKRASLLNSDYFNKDRIISEQELQRIYYQGQIEASQRPKIELKEIILKEEEQLEKPLTEAQNKIVEEIRKAIIDYNKGRVLWNLYCIDDWYEDKSNKLIDYTDRKEYYCNLATIRYSYGEFFFDKNEILIQWDFNTAMRFKPWRILVEKEVLNKDRIDFLDNKKQIIPNVFSLTSTTDLKKINYIRIK